MKNLHQIWIQSIAETAASHRRMIDAAIVQLTDEELTLRPGPGMNSVAVILRHVGGNLQSRWTNFLESDGEWKWMTIKPGESQKHNERTWGSPASRSVFGKSAESTGSP